MRCYSNSPYLAVVGSVLHSQNELRSIGRQQVPVLSLVPLLPVQNLEEISKNNGVEQP